MSEISPSPNDVVMAFRLMLGREPRDSRLAEQLAGRFDSLGELFDHIASTVEFERAGTVRRRLESPVSPELLDWSRKLAILPDSMDGYSDPANAEELLRHVIGKSDDVAPDGRVSIFQSKSMPRSGHHFLVKLLRDYFGSEFAYCEFYNPENCCKQMPCTKPFNQAGTNSLLLQKSHDFRFNDPVDPSQRYLIEYRHPVPRSQSNFELALRRGLREDTHEDFWSFVDASVKYQIAFFRKWIQTPPPNAVLLAYERLSQDPDAELSRVVEFMTGAPADSQRVREAVDHVRPTNAHTSRSFQPRQPEQHRYFDIQRARRAERAVLDACPGVDMPVLFGPDQR